MKKLFFILPLFVSFCAGAQQVQNEVKANTVTINRRLSIRNVSIDTIRTDTTFWGAKSLVTGEAIRKFVEGRVKNVTPTIPTLQQVYDQGNVVANLPEDIVDTVQYEVRYGTDGKFYIHRIGNKKLEWSRAFEVIINPGGDTARLAGEPLSGDWGPYAIHGTDAAGDFGVFKNDLQRVADAGTSLNKRLVIQGNGNMIGCDSCGLVVKQQSIAGGGKDTIATFTAGTSAVPLFSIIQNYGVKAATNFYVANDFAVNTATGLSLSNGRNITLVTGSKIRSYQQPGVFERMYLGVPVFGGVNYGWIFDNDTINGSVYPFPDSNNVIQAAIRFTNHNGYKSDKIRFYATGEIWRAHIPTLTGATIDDSVVVTKNGKDHRIRIGDLFGLFEGGGGMPSFTANRVIVSDGTGAATASAITSTELNSLDDVTGNVQSQLDGKLSTTGNGSGLTGMNKTQVGLSNVDNTSDATKNSAAVTLTNKIISGSANSLSNIPASALVGTISRDRLDTANDVTTKDRRKQLIDSLYALKTPVTLTDGATITQASYNARVVSGGNRTLAISSPEAGQTYTLVYVQDGTGGRKLTGPDGSDIILNKGANDSTLIVLHRQNNGWFISSSVKTSGTYTPTITNIFTTDVITPYGCMWTRIGNSVTVTGYFQTTVTSTGVNAGVTVSLPLSSTFDSFDDLYGSGNATSVSDLTGSGLRISYSGSNASIYWKSLPSGNDIAFTLTYKVQ